MTDRFAPARGAAPVCSAVSRGCTYDLHRAQAVPEMRGDWHSLAWRDVRALSIDRFFARSSDHRPRTEAKLVHSERGIHVLFNVQDRFVRSVCQRYQQHVCRDSCVEFFVQPTPDRGYLNFEINAGGALLLHHVVDPFAEPRAYTVLPDRVLDLVEIHHSLPGRIDPEITEPTNWQIELTVPWRLFEQVVGPIDRVPGTTWRANLYKCADNTSQPHWASWAPIPGEVNFHQPQHFGALYFQV